MEVVDVWTGQRASALQKALRLTNERFAERLGTAVRTVAKWHANPDAQPTPEMQEALDTVLFEASEQAQARFGLMVAAENAQPAGSTPEVTHDADLTAAERRLNADPSIGAALEWLDRQADWAPGTARQRVAAKLVSLNPSALHDRGQRRSRVNRDQLASALRDFYTDLPPGYGTYSAKHDGGRHVRTSVLTCADWLDLACPLDPEHDRAALASLSAEDGGEVDATGLDAAAQRLAETLETNTRLVDAALYRLVDIDIGRGHLAGAFGITSFVQYALTMDLLEGEVVDALADGRGLTGENLPLRRRYLPDTRVVLDVGGRTCAGGALALTAIARPAGPRRAQPDYLLLVQERGGRVLNAARRLAVIPKCFHEPLADYREDTQIGTTLRREMEEELFGRDDVDGTISAQRHADPMHPARLSAPMRWLVEYPDAWALECTGFGINLVSGNYEYPSLVVIHDETFWTEHGGSIAANWESDSLKQYSSLDRDLLGELIDDQAWSNEGLFAFLQGLRRLNELGGERINAPTVEWELE
ncbi:hypothetical protein B0I33_10911 [Prauserella shujinwangii]|uniref:Uncharacterized protein n=1 Tax=Prauserella shujinwangii TaxID=1453103 RepID=A0A2T0LPX2_9PSEU|nr:transcriptional regulator [Prauserella shujinwangii]PRX45350.1 hypothetical protein B0I33_10911 [Prauserella shujinwangii]